MKVLSSHVIGIRLFLVVAVTSLGLATISFQPQSYADNEDSKVTASKSMQLAVASKSKKHKIIYKLNGGKQARKQVKKIASGAILDVAKLKNPKRSGYAFVDWYSNAKLTKKAKLLSGTSKKSKRRVYAKWVKARTLKITYKLNGGKLSGSAAKKFRNTKAVKSLPKAVRAGYAFAGWYSNKKLTKQVESIARGVTKNQVLYAKWEPLSYSIAYSLNGGTLPDDCARSYSAKAPVKVLPTPEKAGYSFMGWYSDIRCTKPIDAIDGTERGNKVLFAKWRKHVLVAHRGLRGENAPENSIQAFRDAAKRGFVEIETDVRFTSDGVPVLIHNATLPMIVDGVVVDAAISELEYDELRASDCACPKAGEDDRNLATFEEGLEACSNLGLRATIHLKTTGEQELETLMTMVKQHSMQDNVRWFTTDLATLDYIKTQMPTASFVYSHSFTKQAANDAIELASDGADVEVSNYRTGVTTSKMKYFKENHVAMRTWGYDDETELTSLDPYVSTVLIDGLVADRMPDPVVY